METSLYLPVKRFLEGLGFAVKGEIAGCDLVAAKGDDPPVVVICELKLSFNLELVLQGVDRATVADEIWLAARLSSRGKGREGDARFRNLCRRLGFGLIGVTEAGTVHVLANPEASGLRRNARRRSRIMAEYHKRQGDPVAGGSTRQPIMTAYRQQALSCASLLSAGPLRPRDVKLVVPDAPKILQSNVYGWFTRPERGIYALSEAGRQALVRWPQPAPAPVGTAQADARHEPESVRNASGDASAAEFARHLTAAGPRGRRRTGLQPR